MNNYQMREFIDGNDVCPKVKCACAHGQMRAHARTVKRVQHARALWPKHAHAQTAGALACGGCGLRGHLGESGRQPTETACMCVRVCARGSLSCVCVCARARALVCAHVRAGAGGRCECVCV